MKTAQEHFEKAVKEFVYPVELATQEDIDWIVTPIREALKDWLEEIQRFMIPWGTLEVKAKVDFITVLLDRVDSKPKLMNPTEQFADACRGIEQEIKKEKEVEIRT